MTGSAPYLLLKQCPRPGTYKVQRDFGTFPNYPVRGHPGPTKQGHHGLRAERRPRSQRPAQGKPRPGPSAPATLWGHVRLGACSVPRSRVAHCDDTRKSSPRPHWPQRGDLLGFGQNPGRMRNLRPVPSQTSAQAECEGGDQEEGGRWAPRPRCPPTLLSTPGTREAPADPQRQERSCPQPLRGTTIRSPSHPELGSCSLDGQGESCENRLPGLGATRSPR